MSQKTYLIAFTEHTVYFFFSDRYRLLNQNVAMDGQGLAALLVGWLNNNNYIIVNANVENSIDI